jgi:hypothetical protein
MTANQAGFVGILHLDYFKVSFDHQPDWFCGYSSFGLLQGQVCKPKDASMVVVHFRLP